ncbi:MAG: AI-2E family transporter [Lachnospiraceae bacterium]|nr:AI-2E family transporter [Lachnospiraceae bacterium]
MKFNFDQRYFKLCKYIGITAILVYLAFSAIDSIPYFYDNILAFLSNILSIASPLITGLVIAFIMLGLVDAIETFMMKNKFLMKHKILCRATGIIVAYAGVIGLFVALIISIYFMIGGQISLNSTLRDIIKAIVDFFNSSSFNTANIEKLLQDFDIPFMDTIQSQMGAIATFLQNILTTVVNNVANFIITVGSNIFSLIVSVIFSIYVIASREYLGSLWDKFFFIVFKKSKTGIVIRRSLGIVKTTFSKYIQGQLIDACFVAIFTGIVFAIMGIDNSFLLGVICGIFNVIPYVGPFIGGGISAVFVLLQGDLWMVLGVIIAVVVVQQIDANIVCPRIIGNIVGLHPALVLAAVTIGGSLYGFLGMIIAVPITASLKILIADWFQTYIMDDYTEFKKNDPGMVSEDDPIFATFKVKKNDATNNVVDNTDNNNTDTPADNSVN